MDDYVRRYNAATERLLDLATQIDRFALERFDAQYTLHDITYVLRSKYADHLFRDRYIGDMQFMGFTPWPKGFCALSTICIYELYGGDTIWEPSAIKLGTWEYAPVVFNRERSHNLVFDTTCDTFAPLHVPYEIASPINKPVGEMRTPNKKMFMQEIKQALDNR